MKWTLSTLVRDGDIYYDYVQQKWNIRTAVLNAYPDVSAEEFAARWVTIALSFARMPDQLDYSVLNSLSQPARVVLCHLACLPSRGVEIALLAHLVNKTEGTVRTLLDECATLGSVVIRNTKVQFVHDKPHTAALGLIDLQEKPRLFAKIARKLEGLSTDYNFVRADMLLSAYHSDPQLLEVHEVVKAGESPVTWLCLINCPAHSAFLQRSELLAKQQQVLLLIWRLLIWSSVLPCGLTIHPKLGNENGTLHWIW